MRFEFDVAVVGAGPAGAAAAGLLGRAGAKVLLLDRRTFPREKPCGEGLLPQGVAVLERLGAAEAVRPLAREFRRLTYRGPAGEIASAAWEGAPGLAVCRSRLDSALLGWALASTNVRFEPGMSADGPLVEGGRVSGVTARGRSGRRAAWSAAVTAAADGLHSVIRRRLGIAARWPRRRRFGATAHVEGLETAEGGVEAFLASGSDVYMTPVPGASAVAVLVEDEPARAPLGEGFLALLRRTPGLEERAAGGRLASPVRLWGPLGPSVERAHGSGFILLGDSAGAPDPITGEGISLALASAEAAAPLILKSAAAGGRAEDLAPYEPFRRELSGDVRRLSDFLVFLTRRRWLASRAVANLGRRPWLFERLLEIARGRLAWSDLGWGERLALVS